MIDTEQTPLLANRNGSSSHSQSAIVESAPTPASTTLPTSTSYRTTASLATLAPFVIAATLARGLTLASRVDVFTRLACKAVLHEKALPISTLSLNTGLDLDPICLSNPVVQSTAADFQTTMQTVLGVLSAITSGFWGGFGDRHGRRWVMILVLLGFLSQDIIFILCATSTDIFGLGYYTLLIGPVVEGFLGSWAAFAAVMNSYVTDCTSPSTRSNAFSRFAGLFFLGVSVGPAVGSTLLRATSWPPLALFFAAITSNLLGLIYVTTWMPESLVQPKSYPIESNPTTDSTSSIPEPVLPSLGGIRKIVRRALEPMLLLAPQKQYVTRRGRRSFRWDCDLAFLGVAVFCGYLTVGVMPNKYLYAEHMFGWTAVELGDYITIAAACRGLWLMVLLPYIVRLTTPKDVGTLPLQSASVPPESETIPHTTTSLPMLQYDLRLACFSLAADAFAYVLTCFMDSGLAFTASTSLGALGGGMYPATQSAMLSLGGLLYGGGGEEVGTGRIMGAIAMIQAMGQNIFGPLLFGLIYARSVSSVPQAIFAAAGFLLSFAIILVLLVEPDKNPIFQSTTGSARPIQYLRAPRNSSKRKRGRSRTSKDLRRSSTSGASGYSSM